MTEPVEDPDEDERRFTLLDAFVADLHAGRAPEREQLLAANPELNNALACLEALHQLVLPAVAADAANKQATRDQGLADAEVPKLGSTFGRYELLEELGRGGMGVVFKAQQLDLDRIVALKMILTGRLASGEEVRRFHAEAQIAARLRHPHIVQIHDAGEIHGQSFFTMEYIEGQNLAGLLQSGPQPAEAAATCLAAVARGVAFLHEQGIIHRDIKPSNVLVDAANRPVLTDFGLVKVLNANDGVTGSGAIVGTPSYMAPEQAASHPDIGPLCDVYSLGAVLYEMLTGQAPFRGPSQLEILLQVLEGEPPSPRSLRPDLPRELELICLKCLEKDPAQRYASAAALADDLEHFLRGEPTEARSNHLGTRLRRWTRREPALFSHLAALTVAACMVQLNHWLGGRAKLPVHWYVEGLLATWALVSLVCQAFLRGERQPVLARIAWLGADAGFLTAVLWLAHATPGPLGVCYALLIAAAGLWREARLVWLTTGFCLIGYTVLLALAPGQESNLGSPLHQFIALVALGLAGAVVAYQVQRLQLLSRFYEKKLSK